MRKHYTQGKEFLLVQAAPKESACRSCYFLRIDCPKDLSTEASNLVCIQVDGGCFIENTPEAIAKFVDERMT